MKSSAQRYASIRTLCLCLLVLCSLYPALGYTQTAPQLSVVGGFFAGPAPRKIEQLRALSLTGLRDGLRWKDIETEAGQYRFDRGSAAQLTDLSQQGLLGPILIQPMVPLYNGGHTVHTPPDLRAFAQYTKAVADQFAHNTIEIGNEFNGGTFVTGDVRLLPPRRRATLHAQMLAEIAKTGVPRDRIIGGALHSMAGGYLWPLLDAGAAAHMGAIALHPYTTSPEAFARQLAFLRQHPEMSKLDIEITEFGTRNTAGAADYFWRYYCQMALADVRRAHWYPLAPRRDGYAPVIDAQRRLTPLGRAVTFAATALAGLPVVALRPDAHTYGCLFDNRVLVLWGGARDVTLKRDDLNIQRSDGRPAERPLRISREHVLLISAPKGGAPIDPSVDIAFGTQRILFDSFDHFMTPTGRPFFSHRGQRMDFALCPGQDRPQAPWFVHLCAPALPRAVLHDRGFTLPNRRAEFHLPYKMRGDATVQAQITLDLNAHSEDGVVLSLWIDGTLKDQRTARAKQEVLFDNIAVKQGETIKVVLSTGPSATGDRGKFRLQLRKK